MSRNQGGRERTRPTILLVYRQDGATGLCTGIDDGDSVPVGVVRRSRTRAREVGEETRGTPTYVGGGAHLRHIDNAYTSSAACGANTTRSLIKGLYLNRDCLAVVKEASTM